MQRMQRMRSLYPNNYPIQQMHIDVLLKQGEIAEAERALDELVGRRSRDPDIWYQVAEVRGLSGNIVGLHQARAEYFALVGDYDQAIQQLGLAKRRSPNFQLASRIDARERQMIEEQRMVKDMMR